MFASVFLVTDTHDERGGHAQEGAVGREPQRHRLRGGKRRRRRAASTVELGYSETDIRRGACRDFDVGERVIVVGQDGLTDGTPVQILKGPGARGEIERAGGREAAASFERPPGAVTTRRRPGRLRRRWTPPGAGGGERMDFDKLTPEQLERVKGNGCVNRGMSDERDRTRPSSVAKNLSPIESPPERSINLDPES